MQTIMDIIVSDNGLSPNRWQAIIWTNAGLLSTQIRLRTQKKAPYILPLQASSGVFFVRAVDKNYSGDPFIARFIIANIL